MNARDAARATQLKAAKPDRTVMLRAAAGSGKTTALVNRFLRLCLENTQARAHPGTILAVTFTRKAAVEIQERLLRRAREMALADPAERSSRLRELFGDRQGREPDAQELAAAAGLYEQLLSDTAGLNLGTIHSFCQLVLSRFSAEAGLDPGFGVLEDPEELRDEAFDTLVGEIAHDPVLGAAARRLGAEPDALRGKLQACLDENMRLERWLRKAAPAATFDPSRPRLPRLDALPHLEADLRRHLFPDLPGDEGDFIGALCERLAAELSTLARKLPAAVDETFGDDLPDVPRRDLAAMVATVSALAAAWETRPGGDASPIAVAALGSGARKLFLTSGKLRSFTKGGGAKFKQPYNDLVAGLVRPAVAALVDVERHELLADNVALLRLGLRLLDLVDDLKRRDRVIDFQDLEDLASRLLSDSARAMELQYRLDAAIQHILVDEFQDTNINQWELLKPFRDEFLSGGGERKRTTFLVGDVKQSIYGFRGAQPWLFGKVAADMAGYDCDLLDLPTNFRSLRAIVEGVGALFNAPPLAGRLEPEEQAGVRDQQWARDDEPGTFVIHAPVPDPAGPDDATAGGGQQAAARAAAALVKRLRDGQEPVHDPQANTWRPLQWRDVLVLARTRTDFALYEGAFRDAGIPFVPPGRGMLAASREVQDVLALLRWLAWADDDVALATVLRSPIARLDQATFQALLSSRGVLEQDANGRWRTPRSLWWALRESAGEPLATIATQLGEWRRKLDYEPCHDLLRRIMRDADLPHRYQVALGEQARFNLERLYDLALGADVQGVPTARRLADVIARAAGRGSQEEAPLPSDGEGRVRFLTVHGAKGLEAPVVLLVDADRGVGRAGARVCLEPDADDSPLLLSTAARHRAGVEFPAGVEPLADPLAAAVADAKRRGDAERAHLLYVALTRARDRLHVIGGVHRPKAGEEYESPLRDLRAAAGAAEPACPLIQVPGPEEDGLAELEAALDKAAGRAPHEPPPAPQSWQPPPRRARFGIVAPSAAADEGGGQGGGDHLDTRPGRAPAAAIESGLSPAAHGDLVHRLLQAACGVGAMPPGAGLAHDEAARVFAARDLEWVFHAPEGGAAWSEAPVIARRAAPSPGARAAAEQRITGIIDRLVVRPGRVDIIDYKTNRGAADPAQRAWLLEHYRPQLVAYREVITALYPDRAVRTWLLFTDPLLADQPRLHEVV